MDDLAIRYPAGMEKKNQFYVIQINVQMKPKGQSCLVDSVVFCYDGTGCDKALAYCNRASNLNSLALMICLIILGLRGL